MSVFEIGELSDINAISPIYLALGSKFKILSNASFSFLASKLTTLPSLNSK